MDSTTIPGMVIDARGQIAVAILSEETVGVSVRRYNNLPSPADLRAVINSEKWVTVYRKYGGDLFLVQPQGEDDYDVALTTPQENEAGQFAIELALHAWPEWCPHYREQFKPKSFIPFPTEIPEA